MCASLERTDEWAGMASPPHLASFVCKPSESQEPSDTAPPRDLKRGRCPEVIGRENTAVVSQCPGAALQGKTGLGIERDAKGKL